MALYLYNQGKIHDSFALLDSLRYARQDSCNQLEYVILKTDRYRLGNAVSKAFKYIKSKESNIHFCDPNDEYKYMLQKAYMASYSTHIDEASSLFNQAENIQNTISDTSSFGIKRLHIRAKIAKHFGRTEECRQLINEAIDIQLYRNKLTHPESSGFLRTFAYSYLEEGQFEKAREYFRMERQIYAAHKKTFPKLLGVMFYNEANTHYEQLEFQEAITDYDSTLFYWDIDSPSKVYLRYAHEALGDLHYELGNMELASKYWTQASEIKPPQNNDKTERLPDLNKLASDTNFEKLSNAYSDALAFRKSTYGNDHELTGECLTFVGRLSEIQNHNQKALQTYNEALGILIPGFDFRSGVLPLDTLGKVDRYGFDAFLGMARVFFDLYKSSRDLLFLDSANNITQYAFAALDKVKVSFEDSHTALFWSDFTYPLTEISLKIHHTYNTTSRSNENSKIAFQNSETSKAYLLRSFLHKDKILRKGKLPLDVKNKEQKLTATLNRLKGSIRMEEKRCGDAQQAKISVWQAELLKAQQEYASFLTMVAKNHPEHYKKLYDTPSLDKDQLLKMLEQKKATFISFFYGEENIYRFHSENQSIYMQEISLSNDFKQTFSETIDQLNKYQDSPDLNSTSKKLFDFLMADLSIPDEYSIVIIPDGPLYYLPWEALVMSLDQNAIPEYLITKHPISYVQSATLLADYLSTPSKAGKKILSISPEYKIPLTFSSEDLQRENQTFRIHKLMNSDVKKENIIKLATNADIIHFAGHSTVNEDNEMMSELDLGKYEDEALHSHEIFDMDLDAALVVLSSCHSGSGKYARGEGIMNFSQAFQQAGSESVILSMWNVDDKSTSELFANFYDALGKGKRKSTALREAKLKLINSGDPLISHPYFWASFTLIGDDDPIKIHSPIWNYLLFAAVIFLLALLAYKKFRPIS